jgi:hypothetical protein
LLPTFRSFSGGGICVSVGQVISQYQRPSHVSLPAVKYYQHTLDADDTAKAVGNFVEGHQISSCWRQESTISGHSILRFGTDIIDLKEIQNAESDCLDFATQLDPSNHNRPLFHGASSPAILVKKALEYKSAFADSPVRGPTFRDLRLHPWEITAVRDTDTFLALLYTNN